MFQILRELKQAQINLQTYGNTITNDLSPGRRLIQCFIDLSTHNSSFLQKKE